MGDKKVGAILGQHHVIWVFICGDGRRKAQIPTVYHPNLRSPPYRHIQRCLIWRKHTGIGLGRQVDTAYDALGCDVQFIQGIVFFGYHIDVGIRGGKSRGRNFDRPGVVQDNFSVKDKLFVLDLIDQYFVVVSA